MTNCSHYNTWLYDVFSQNDAKIWRITESCCSDLCIMYSQPLMLVVLVSLQQECMVMIGQNLAYTVAWVTCITDM